MTIRVLIADDQEAVRQALRLTLDAESDIQVVDEAANGAEAVRKAMWRRCDVVVMDVRMPYMDGIAAIRELTAAAPATKILALTTFDLDDYLFGALRVGAAGFLLKDSDPDLLVASIRALHRGTGWWTPR